MASSMLEALEAYNKINMKAGAVLNKSNLENFLFT